MSLSEDLETIEFIEKCIKENRDPRSWWDGRPSLINDFICRNSQNRYENELIKAKKLHYDINNIPYSQDIVDYVVKRRKTFRENEKKIEEAEKNQRRNS